jgi:lipopolysaccharide export system protein LptA
MKGRRRFALAKTARRVIAVALAGVCLVIAFYFLGRWRGRVKVQVADRAIPAQKVESQEKVRHFVYKSDKERIVLKADQNAAGVDGLFHLKGNVEVVRYALNDKPPVTIRGDEAAYDKDLLHIKFKGRVTVLYQDTTIQTPQFEYAKDGEILKTDQGVAFETRKGRGSARRLTYLVKENRLLFKDKVVLEAKPNRPGAETVHIEGDALEYNRRLKRGIVRGNVSLRMGRSRASAGRLSFELSGNEERFRSLTLEENATAVMPQEGSDVERTIEAGKLLLRGFADLDQVRSLEAKGKCRAVFQFASGVPAELAAPEIKAGFDREGRLQQLVSKGAVRVVEKPADPAEARTITGELLTINGRAETMTFSPAAKAKKQRKTRLVSSKAELEAETILIDYGSGDLKAQGGVEAILQPGSGGKVPSGLFAGQDPVFVTTDSLRYFKAAKRSVYQGEARFWQGKQVVQADTIQIFEDTGSLEGRGKVKSQFWHKPKDSPNDEKVEINGDAIEFRPGERRVYFRKECIVKARDAVLEADWVTMDLAEGTADMTQILAKGSVKIQQGAWEGRGGRAEFAVPDEVIVLLEKPVLVEKDKGETQGDKLTFQLADGKILIENRRRDRSVTVIKS